MGYKIKFILQRFVNVASYNLHTLLSICKSLIIFKVSGICHEGINKSIVLTSMLII